MSVPRRATVALVAVCGAGLALAASRPTARTWIGHESAIERHLRIARVTRLEDIGTGVTRPRRAFLDPVLPCGSFAWKAISPGRRGGYQESYKSEIAAYELDKLLGLRMVPPAVEREIDGEIGAAVMWLDGARSVKQTGGGVPSSPVWGRDARRMQMFDNLIGNIDRNAGNILLGAPGELILIDHSRAFVTNTTLPHTFERVDAGLWARMTAITRVELAGALGRWVDDPAIEAMLRRRQRMATRVATLIAQRGRESVLVR
jgi:hypothetical protein